MNHEGHEETIEAHEVDKEGPGFLASIYRRAMYVELKASGLSYEAERPRFRCGTENRI